MGLIFVSRVSVCRLVLATAVTSAALLGALGGPGAPARAAHASRTASTVAHTGAAVTGLTIRVSALNAGTRVVPAHVPAGIVPFTVIDDLSGPAGALVFRVNRGYTAQRALAIFMDQKAPQGRLTRAATFVAGFTGFVPGQRLSGWVRLTPGAYVVVSGGPFQPHDQTFAVDPAPGASPAAPASTATVTMEENKFALPAVLPAGRITFQIKNIDTDLHLTYLARLGREVSLAQLKRALTLPEAKQPAWLHSAAATGAAGILSGGQTMWWTLRLTPGHYAVVCPLPGPDGKPHFLMGMLALLDVR